jgi:hypothetical protein
MDRAAGGPDARAGRRARVCRLLESLSVDGPRYTKSMPPRTTPSDALAPDPVIEAYKKDIDRSLLRENLKLTPGQRLAKLQAFAAAMAQIRGAATRR